MIKKLNIVAGILVCIATTATSVAQTKTTAAKATPAKTATKAQAGKIIYTKDPATGVEYHFFKHDKKGKMPVMGDFVNVKMVFKNDKDSEINNSAKKGGDSLGTYKLQLTKLFNGCLEQGIAMMAIGDSAIFKVSTDSMFLKMNRNPRAKLPPFLHLGTALTFSIKLVKFQTQEEIAAEQKKATEAVHMKEKASIAKYFADSNIHVTPTTDSVMVLKYTPTTNKLIQDGDSVYVTYVGKLLNGQVFDQSANHAGAPGFVTIAGRPTLATVYTPSMHLIQGWVIALSRMHNGDKITILTPSSMAYGEHGAGGAIGPFTPLIFDMEVLKVVSNK
ncbi:MAG TPA: FKBP-type peptidyl-prolyl cis-trans isomerase [Bacteroidia bacterium]|jgi:FKBP-type peptidyl-prolyl cis-trans isomerase FkpA|nr:FKBP-type peptidyl-prolyl cis-trans isomerase [Bacteroidia bacterium]